MPRSRICASISQKNVIGKLFTFKTQLFSETFISFHVILFVFPFQLSGLHEKDTCEPCQKGEEKKSSSLVKEESPPVLSPQKYHPHLPAFNKEPAVVTQSKSLSTEDGLTKSAFSSSSSTAAAADSSSSHTQKKSDKTSAAPIRINSSDSDFSLPSPVADSAEELDLSAVVFHTAPLKSLARTEQMPFPSAVNGNIDSDTDSENLSTTSSQVTSSQMTPRPKRSCTVVKAPYKIEDEKDGVQVSRLIKRKTKNRNLHIMKKRKGLGE